jgi:hypothetical protein
MARALVQLPPGIGNSFEVFVNGVPQERGRDYHVEGDKLVFDRELEGEGQLGFVRWLSMFLGIAGTYKKNDLVDIVYHHDGQRLVASGLPIVPEESP